MYSFPKNSLHILLSWRFSAKLSADLAYPITGSVQLQTQMEKLYRDKLSEARSVDGMEGFVDEQYKVQNTYFFWCNSCEYGYYK